MRIHLHYKRIAARRPVGQQLAPFSLSISLALSLFPLFHTSLSLSLSDSLVRLFLRAGSEKKNKLCYFCASFLLLFLLNVVAVVAVAADFGAAFRHCCCCCSVLFGNGVNELFKVKLQ